MRAITDFPRSRVRKPMAEWQGFYSTSQVSRIARIPDSTLRYWKTKKIFEPSLLVIENGDVVDYGYSYADLTILRLLRAIRDDRLNLKSVGIALRHLYDRFGPVKNGWSDKHVYILGQQVYADWQDDWEVTTATKYGQRIETRLFGDLFDILREAEEGGSILVPRDFAPYVEIDPKIMGGEPGVRGTRIPTHALFLKFLAGKSQAQLARLYQLAETIIEKVVEYEQFLNSPIPKARAVPTGR